jgi:Homeodomain-like domain-containing protein
MLRRTAPVRAAMSASFDGVAGGGLRSGLTVRAAARERARVGRVLLAAGRTPGQVARACGVSARTVQRWATPTPTTCMPATTGTAGTPGGVGTTGAAPTTRAGAGEGSAAATGLPSGSPQHTTARQAHEHRKGERG